MWATFYYTYWPVVYITLSGDITTQDYDQFKNEFMSLYDRQQVFQVIIDTTGVGSVGMSYLSKQASFMKTTEAQSRKYLRRMAIVMTDPLIKMLLKSLFCLRKPVVPVKVVNSSDEAYTWLQCVQ